MASEPNFNPNHFVRGGEADPNWDEQRWNDPLMAPQKNRVLKENFHPGSIFKIVVGLAELETGLNPDELYPAQGGIFIGKRWIKDQAGAGNFDFKHALAKSSNAYFIFHGMKPGVLARILALGQQLHLGERTSLLPPNQEAPGIFPNPRKVTLASGWFDGDTANLCIGQGKIDVTPVQMAVMVSAVANGGTVLWPRVVSRLESADGIGTPKQFPQGRIRDHIIVSQRSLDIVRRAMLEDVEGSEGSGHGTYMPNWHIAGKTGTAEVERGGRKDSSAQDTWFVSYAPYENPRYVVVVMVEGGNSGGRTCVPVARKIYEAIIKWENKPAPKNQTLAEGRQ
jgi:penicillin-binding protein 2